MADPSRNDRLYEVLGEYHEAVEAGHPPDRDALLAAHPDLAPEIEDYLDEQDRLHRLAGPFRPANVPEGEATPIDRDRGPAIGDVVRYVGDYELRREIARGGMGVVFEARQISLNRTVALKMIRSGELADDDDRQRFRLEAEAAASLDHPNIVPIYEVGSHLGQAYFSMKWIEGGSLADRLPEFTADPRKSALLMAEVARAVHHAHLRGILHRDLKPSNILIDADGHPQVTDFGLAKRVDVDAELTASNAMLGTPSYMAPEQASPRRGGITTATDIHGLGAILYAMLAGRAPFLGSTPLETLDQVRSRDPEPPVRSGQSVDRDLETICLKCLAKDPHGRYESASAVADDLDRWRRGEPIAARPAGKTERAWRWCKRNPVIAGLSATIAVLLVSGVVGLVASNRAIARQRSLVLAQRDRTLRSLDRSREALDEVLTRFIGMPFFAQGGGKLQPLRKQLLQKAADLYDEVELDQANDPTQGVEAGRTARRLGDTQAELELFDQAEQSYRRAIARLENARLRDAAPAELVKTRLALARLMAHSRANGRDQMERVFEAFRTGLAASEDLMRDHPSELDYRRDFGLTSHAYGAALSKAGRAVEANEALRQAEKALLEIIAVRGEIEEGYHYLLAITLDLRGGVQMPSNQDEAIRLRQRAVAHQQIALRAKPFSPAYLQGHGTREGSLADSLTAAGRYDEAIAAVRSGLVSETKFAANFPDLGSARRRLAETHAKLARLLILIGHSIEARYALRRSLDLYDQLVVSFPQEGLYRQNRQAVRGEFARLLPTDTMPSDLNSFARPLGPLAPLTDPSDK